MGLKTSLTNEQMDNMDPREYIRKGPFGEFSKRAWRRANAVLDKLEAAEAKLSAANLQVLGLMAQQREYIEEIDELRMEIEKLKHGGELPEIYE
jgi:peptidoglycan hydrolase CwlO-like protein